MRESRARSVAKPSFARAALRVAVILFVSSAACAGAGVESNKDETVYREGQVAFRLPGVPPTWKKINVSHASLSFRDDVHDASILINGRCTSLDGDTPLVALTNHLVMGTTEREVRAQNVEPFDGREALHTRMFAKLDGVGFAFDIFVLKKDGCVYDFVYIATPDVIDAGAPIFASFARGFHTLAGFGGDVEIMAESSTWSFIEALGDIAILTRDTMRSLFRRPFEIKSTIYQMESLGVRSLGIVSVTSVFIGMVMTIQFAFGLRRFGGLEYAPRVIVLTFLRELAPTLTAVIVGGRIASGMAAEVGAMNVTEQVDAIRALGADPAKKLVVPRVVAATLVMPLLSVYALVLGTLGSMLICNFQYDINPSAYLLSAMEVVRISDFISGLAKTPFFGFLIAIIGCYFGLHTRGGTEGVGRSTTRTVVAVSIAILIADLLQTKLLIAIIS